MGQAVFQRAQAFRQACLSIPVRSREKHSFQRARCAHSGQLSLRRHCKGPGLLGGKEYELQGILGFALARGITEITTLLSHHSCHTADSKVGRWAMKALRDVEGWDPQNCLSCTP